MSTNDNTASTVGLVSILLLSSGAVVVLFNEVNFEYDSLCRPPILIAF